MKHEIKIDDVLEIEIKKLGINGEGIGYVEKLAVFVQDALPGEIIEAKVTQVFETRCVAEIHSIITPSPDRLEVKFPDYQASGAYGMQHMTYESTLSFKRDILINSLNRYVDDKIVYHKIKHTLGMQNPFGYRNKVSLPSRKIGGKNRFGLFKEGSTEFVPVNDSPVSHQKVNEVVQSIELLMDEYKFDAYIAKDKSGYLKSVVVRRGEFTGEIQVSFMLMKPYAKIQEIGQKLITIHPEIVSIFAFYTDDYKEQVFFSRRVEKIFGKDTINERINGQVYSLYPESFFQLNTKQADIFYKKMAELANLSGTEVCVDAYAGIAPISHYIAKDAQTVYAIEIDEKSVKSAILSLKRNYIKNVKVVQSDFRKALKHLGDIQIDVMFFDPPRGGLGYDTIKEVLKYMPKKIVYGSCNPSTLAKDLNDLLKYYELKEIVPIDMFPFTPLVESITLLELKEPNKTSENK